MCGTKGREFESRQGHPCLRVTDLSLSRPISLYAGFSAVTYLYTFDILCYNVQVLKLPRFRGPVQGLKVCIYWDF